MFPEPTELLLIGYLIRINLDPKIQIKYIDTQNQLANILTNRNFTRDEWNRLLCLFNINHFSSTNCLEVMSTRTQEDAGEERVTAKSLPKMNLVSRYGARDPNVFASTASECLVKTKSESQEPLSSWNGQQPRTGRHVMDACSSNCSEWDTDEKWSSQEWKSDEVKPVFFTQHTDRFVIDDEDMDTNTFAESDMSSESKSFLHRVNDRVRKMLDQSSKDAMQDSDKHSVIWRMFMSSTLHASDSIKNTEDLTWKQMFDISEKLIVGQSDEIFGVSPINWEDSPWRQLSLVNDEEVISLSHAKVFLFRILFSLGKVNQNPTSNTVKKS